MARVTRPDGELPRVGDVVTGLDFEYGNLTEVSVQSAQEMARRYWFGSGWSLIREGLRRMRTAEYNRGPS
jgi:hypothetical protein